MLYLLSYCRRHGEAVTVQWRWMLYAGLWSPGVLRDGVP